MPLLMVFGLVACAVNKNEPSAIKVEDEKATQEQKTLAEVLIENDFHATSNSSTELAIIPNKKTELSDDSSLDLRKAKDRLASGAASPNNQKKTIQKPSSVISAEEIISGDDPVKELCGELGRKLGSVSVEDCLNQNLIHSELTIKKRSLAFKDYAPKKASDSLGRVLVIGGINGDEYSSVSVIFKWMEILNEEGEQLNSLVKEGMQLA